MVSSVVFPVHLDQVIWRQGDGARDLGMTLNFQLFPLGQACICLVLGQGFWWGGPGGRAHLEGCASALPCTFLLDLCTPFLQPPQLPASVLTPLV